MSYSSFGVTLKYGLGSFKVIENGADGWITYTTLYWSAVVTIALSFTIFKLFDVQNIMTLKFRFGVIEGQ